MGLISEFERFFSAHAPVIAKPSWTGSEYAAATWGVDKIDALGYLFGGPMWAIEEVSRLTIRAETAADHDAIADLLRESFPSPGEAQLTARLREDGETVLALVAESKGAILAFAMFSRMVSPPRMLGLGPVATAQAARKRGLASALIREGLTLARADGWEACFVLGNPAFYERFGFRGDFAATFTSAYAGPHFMAIPLQGPEMPVRTGVVAYAKGFMEF